MNTALNRLRSLVALLWREVAKFGLVGGVAFVIEAGSTWILVHTIMDGSDAKARIVGACIATMFAWVANRLWTFRDRTTGSKRVELAKFIVINVFGMMIAAGFTWFAKYGLEIQSKNVVWMWGNAGVVVATVIRFFAYRFWVFNRELDSEPEWAQDRRILEPERPHS